MNEIPVRMRMFSGLADPRWTITDPGVIRSVRDWFADGDKHHWEGRQQRSADALPVTGYRGFDVTIGGQVRRVFRNAPVELTTVAPHPGLRTIDQILYQSNAVELRQTFGIDAEELTRQTLSPIAGLPATCSTSALTLGDARYRPTAWDDDPFCDDTCYGYAADVRTGDVVIPNDSTRQNWSAAQLVTALAADGFAAPVATVPHAPPAGEHYIVALISPLMGASGDFHFLRLDRSGCWSQKVGTDRVTQRDDQSPPHKLTDLCAARFLAPFTFVGFFVVTSNIQQRLQERGDG